MPRAAQYADPRHCGAEPRNGVCAPVGGDCRGRAHAAGVDVRERLPQPGGEKRGGEGKEDAAASRRVEVRYVLKTE